MLFGKFALLSIALFAVISGGTYIDKRYDEEPRATATMLALIVTGFYLFAQWCGVVKTLVQLG